MSVFDNVAPRVRGARLLASLSGIALALGAATVNAEGSRSLYPSGYTATPLQCDATHACRADYDLTGSGAGPYLGIIPRRAFIYVYAQANEYILLGSRNRTNGGDIFIYNPQSFGSKGNETIPGVASFTCSAAAPAGSFGGGTTGQIITRANELAGPNSADNSVTVANGYAPCAYKAPSTGIYGVLFSVATSGGSAPTGIIDPPAVGNASVSAWDVTVRATQTSMADLNTRVFTYAWVGFTNSNPRPISHTLYYVTLDGSRYSQTMQGLDPNAYALFGNNAGFLDSGQPLYKDVRGTNQTVTTLVAGENNILPQAPQAPVFFSSPDPSGPNATETARVLTALGIPGSVTLPALSGVTFSGAQSGNQTYVNAGGTFKFTTQSAVSYQIVVSIDGLNFDPGSPTNATLAGFAPDGLNSVIWNGKNNNGVAFPSGNYTFQIFARNGEIHFPIVDTEGNANGGPTLTKLNGTVGDHTVFYDDRGYVTRSGNTVGTLNGNLCTTANPIPPSPDHSLTGVDSSLKNLACSSGSGGTCYYRWWPGDTNNNTDCSNTATAAFGDAKGLDLWAYQQTTVPNPTLVINPQPVTATNTTTVAVPPSTFPNQQVFGSFQFENVSTTNSTGTTYTVVIGTPGNCPTALAFTLLPAGVTFTGFNAATCVATFAGLPATLNASTQLNFNFNYIAPASGTVPVTTTINSGNAPSANATGTTVITTADVAATVSVPATAPGGSTVSGTVTFGDLAAATANADGVVYTMSIGTAGSCPAGVTFPSLPAGVTASYNTTSCQVTFTGMPATLTIGQTLSIGFQYTGPASGSVPVNASVSTTTPESSTANNSASGTTVFASADLSITKTDGTASVNAGATVTYTIVVSNAGPSAANNAVFTDPSVANLTVTNVTCGSASGGAVCPASSVAAMQGPGITIATLPSGGSLTFTVTGTAGASGSIVNTATITPPAGTSDPNNADNSATDTDTINPRADLSITKTDGTPTVNAGTTHTYTIVVSNAGPSAADGAIFQDPATANVTVTNVSCGSPTGGAVCPVAPTVVAMQGAGIAIPTLPNGGSVTFSVTYTAGVSGSLSNTATITAPAGVTDPNLGNNSASDADLIIGLADLAITKTDGVASVNAGGAVSYSIVVSNAGPSPANNAVFKDPAVANLTVSTVTCGSASGGAVCPATSVAAMQGAGITIATLPSGGSLTFTVSGTAGASGSIVNTATIAAPAGTNDPNPADNSSTDTDTIISQADLSITKTDGVTTATPGGSVTYTITASNAGPLPVTGATVTDTFPAVLTATWTCVGAGGGTCTASGSGNINQSVNLPVGASVTFTVSATISASATGTLSNTATVFPPAGITDPNNANNSATDTDTLNPSADLSITKTDGVTTVTAGGSTTYTITASNAGPSNVIGATVADTFPASLTATWTCAGVGGGTCTASGSGNINDTVNLPVGGSVTYTVSANISASATGSLSNTATVTPPAGVTDPTPGNNSATDTDTITQSADLSITKTDGVTTVTAGGTTTYTITASNAGPSNVTGATVADTFPASLTATWTCVGAGGGTCTASGTGNINATVNLPAGASVTFTVTANISAAATGSLTNTATVTPPAGVTDPTPGNNTATDTDTIGVSADLSITKTDGVTTVTAGGTTNYTITASNAGPSNVTGATVADTFPASLTATWTCVGAGGGTCTASGSGNINDTVNLPVGGSVTYTVSASINASASGTLTNTATVTPPAGVTDPVPGNNSATDTDTISGTADLSITKNDGVTTVTAGGTTVYTITASNAGPSNVAGATVADTFPASITSATWTCAGAGGGTCTASGSGNINATVNLPSGASVTFTVTANISASATGSLSNTASVAVPAGITDPTPGNNSATDTDTISATADLSITKTDGVTTVTAGGTTTYTITASNAGPSNVVGATVADTLPAPITSATWTCAGVGGGTCTASGSGNINATVNLPAGASVTFTVTANISASATGSLSNTATVTQPAGVTDPTPGNNSATDTDTIAQQADLAITKSDGATSYTPGGTLTYTIVASNAGPSSVTGATIADTFGASFTAHTWTAISTGGASGFTASGSGNINDTVNMPVGSTITYTVTATVSLAATGALSNTATVAPPAGVTDPNPANNSATDTDNNGGAVQLTIAKTATPGAFAVGQTGTYSLLVSNTGTTSTSGAINVSDPLPAGITTTATPSGTGWNCSASTTTNVSCTTAAVLLPGGNAPVINVPVTIAVGTASPAVNAATVSGGGDPNCPAAANCVSTISTPVNAPLIDVTKTLTANFVVGVPTSYVITATNNGQAATLAGTISDTIPAGLTIGTLPPGCSSGGGQLVNCTLPAGIAVGGSVSYTIPVTPQASANGQNISNTATATGGGDPSCPAASHCDDTVTNTVTAPQLQLIKSATPSPFVVGQPATYTLTLTNNGTAATTAMVTITDTIPGGLTIGALPAGCTAAGQTVTCTVAAPLNTGAPVAFAIAVTPQASLTGQSVTNSAGATGGGDPGCADLTPIGSLPARCVGTVITPVNAPQLTIQKSASAAGFVVGVAANYTLQVTNTGTAATTAAATITDVLPGTLTIGTLPGSCSATGQQVTCTIAAGLATGSSVSFVIPVTPTAAASGTSLSNTATVSGGGDPTCPTTSNCTSTVITPVDAPQLTIVKTASAPNFVVGVAASYTLTVTNTGTAPTTAAATVSDALPGTLTIGTLPGGCSAAGQNVTCTIAAPLNTNAPVSFVIPVTPTAAASGTSLTNTANVSGGGDPSCPGAANCSSTVITPVDTPQLRIVKTSPPSFVVGVAATYTLTITNIGSAATTASATVVDNVPGTLALGTMPGGCTASGQQVTCTIAAPLAPNAQVAFTIPVTPTPAANGTTLINTATITGGGDPTCPGAANCTSTVGTPVGAPQLQIVKTASAPSFVVGTPASYTLTVTNIGSASTTSTATVVDNIPGTLTIGTLPGGCSAAIQQVTCTIAAPLAPNTPVSFTVPVTPTAATGGTTVTNTATVSGGGDPTCPAAANCTSTVDTPVTVVVTAADLHIVKLGPAQATAGQNIVYTITVTNVGPDTALNAVLSDPAPAGLTFVSSGAPCPTFPCNLGNITANQSIVIPNVTFHVAANYGTGMIVNVASVTSTTPDPTPNNNSSSASTPVVTGGTPQVVAAPIDARWMLLMIAGMLALMGARRIRAQR
jgi:uncharacterized repeat protein (TIGR01451 family)